MEGTRAQELLKEHAKAVNDYREFLREKIKDCADRLERERNYSIRCAESGDFAEIHPDALVSRRVELETYEVAAFKLEELIENSGTAEGDKQ